MKSTSQRSRQAAKDKAERELDALRLTAEENYAHARDHESLRAQVTSMLVAAAFVLIGLAIDNVEGVKRYYVAALVILIGVLNLLVIYIHDNRFDRHVSIARNAKSKISRVEVVADVPKKLSLSAAWQLVASLPIAAGIGLLFVAWAS
jgi:hypothetical protein